MPWLGEAAHTRADLTCKWDSLALGCTPHGTLLQQEHMRGDCGSSCGWLQSCTVARLQQDVQAACRTHSTCGGVAAAWRRPIPPQHQQLHPPAGQPGAPRSTLTDQTQVGNMRSQVLPGCLP